MALVARYGRPYRSRLLLLAFLSPLESVPPLLTPLVMQLLIDKAYPARDLFLFGWLCAALLALRMIPNVLVSLSGYLTTYVQTLLQYRLCLRLSNAIQRLPLSSSEGRGSGALLERVTRDVGAVAQSITQLLPEMMSILFTFLAAIPLMLRLSAKITLLALAVVPVNYVIRVCLSCRLRKLYGAKRVTDEKITTFTSEAIEGVMVARIFALGRWRRRRLKQLLRDNLDATFAIWRATTFWGQLGSLINLIWSMVLLCGGWYLVFTDRLQLGEAVALGMYVGILTQPFQQVDRLYQSLMRDSVAAGRVLEIMDAHPGTARHEARRALAHAPHRFELRGASFTYQQGRIGLSQLDLLLQCGETVAVVGPNGAGKSTLIRILSGLDDRYQGLFLVDGYDFRKIQRDSYLHHVSLVSQNTFFFSGSIRDNLGSGGGRISLADLRSYANILGLEDIINSTPQGYDTQLGSEGIRLSAGQYQKLAALRAVLKGSSLLLLDEATSALDVESERRLLKGIVALRPRGCMTVLVTHHIAITAEPWIDRILVLIDGRVAESGSCAELCAMRGFYHHWLTLNQASALDRGLPVEGYSQQRG